MASNISKASPIVVVGAGVFGLSTAMHLAKRGYTNVKVIDKQPYHKTLYSYDLGCDAASADINKILRASYGPQIEYQNLALDSIAEFTRWNEAIESGKSLPPGFKTSDQIFCNNGNLTMNDDENLTQFDIETMKNMDAVGLKKSQIVLTNPEHVKQAEDEGYGFAINPFRRPTAENFGLLDTKGGMVYADRACRFALYQAEKMGVKFVLDSQQGALSRFLYASDSDRVIGVQTLDGTFHFAELTIMACGGWTPSLIPELDGLCETTGGSVAIFQLPAGNKQLWDRYAPENFPTWKYKIRDGAAGGVYGFARDSMGRVKIGYRGTKYTNPQTQADGAVRSVPITRWTAEATRQLPQQAAKVIRDFVEKYMPELQSCAMKSRLCWYTDSFDNHFLVDFIPGKSGLMVATGGSGHGFKFLPNLGRYVVDRIEGVDDGTGLLKKWTWRSLPQQQVPYNKIMQGKDSEKSLLRQALTKDDSLFSHVSNL
ncbi:FAD dependent oxidoreductase [Trichoderma velutinum]